MKILTLLLLVAVFTVFGCVAGLKKSNLPSADIEDKETTVPFVLHDNRIMVNVMVNGKGPYSFVFDTGGSRSNTITPEVAKELSLRLKPGPAASGAGSGKQESHLTHVESYAVGNLVAQEQAMTVIDMSAIKRAFAFPRLDGIIGFDVLKKSVTCIDYEKQVLTFKESGGDCFTASEKTVIPIRIDHDSPMIRGSVNGIVTEFFVDTGDRSAFSIFQKFSKASGLENKFVGRPEVISGHGIGGPIPAKIATFEEITMGSNVKIKNVVSRLPLTSGGFFAKSALGGSIGNEILRRFNIVLDYSKQELRIVKNRNFDEPFTFVPPREI